MVVVAVDGARRRVGRQLATRRLQAERREHALAQQRFVARRTLLVRQRAPEQADAEIGVDILLARRAADAQACWYSSPLVVEPIYVSRRAR
jgi:hypothetical protein